jgi:hypothetical protein
LIDDPVVNVYSDQSAFSGTGAVYDPELEEHTFVVEEGNTDSWRGVIYTKTDAVATPGSTWTFSFEAWCEQEVGLTTDVNNYGVTTSLPSNDNDITSERVYREVNVVPGKWTKYSVTYTFPSDLGQNVYMRNKPCIANGYVPSRRLVVKMRNFMCVERDWPVPYEPISRGSGKLALPYDIIDLKQDFTIHGWWKPEQLGTGYSAALSRNLVSGQYSGHRILIMTNSSTDPTSYLRCWYGSGGTETNFATSAARVDKGEWHFFCLRRSGNTMTLFSGNKNLGLISTTDGNGAYLNTDEDPVNQGWLVGEYNADRSNGFHRDYAFIQEALSDDDINSIYRTQMETIAQDHILRVSNGISTGELL